MGHSRSFLTAVLLSYVLFLISAPVLAIDVPHLTLQKNHFSESEQISVLYEGAPTSLTAHLIDHTDSKVKYKAVLNSRNGQTFMDFVTTDPLNPGKYALKVWKDNDKLIDTYVYWGVPDNAAPEPSAAETAKGHINRDAPTVIEPEKIYTVNLSFTAERDFRGTITDLVPYDAIVDATDAAQIKKPELLSLRMPFDNDYEMTDGFGAVNPKDHMGLSDHDGTDFATPMGTPIFAVDDGEIVPYREVNQYGITQAVQHSWGTTFYGHLQSTPSAEIGQKVRKGQQIGRSGNTGLSTGPHLHFGMKWNNDFVDGLPYIRNKASSVSDQKMLSWDIDVKQGEKVTKSYLFLLPQESTAEADLMLGPAVSKDIPEKYSVEEEKFWNLSLHPGSEIERHDDP